MTRQEMLSDLLDAGLTAEELAGIRLRHLKVLWSAWKEAHS